MDEPSGEAERRFKILIMAKKKVIKARKAMEVKVTVRTSKTGYLLEVDDKGYMYFDVVELAKGLILHAGLGRKSPTTKFGRDALLRAIGNGSAERRMQKEINALQTKVESLTNKLYGQQKEQEGHQSEEMLRLV